MTNWAYRLVDLRPTGNLKIRLDAAYERVMTSGRYIGGLEVEGFEAEWAEYNGAPYCVSCGNGFDALQLVLRAWGVGHGYEIGVPAWTAPPTWAAVEALGATPVVGPGHFSISVHLYGIPAREPPAFSIQDAAQAHGLKLIGTCAWSFYPTKNLGAFGDGGAVTTHDADLADALRGLRRYQGPGAVNSCLDPLQAAFLRVKLRYLDGWNERRRENAARYFELLTDVPWLTLPDVEDVTEPVWHQFVVQVRDRAGLQAYLAENGVQTGVHYPVPPHRALGYAYQLPEADRLAAQVLSLPVGPHLSTAAIDEIATILLRSNAR